MLKLNVHVLKLTYLLTYLILSACVPGLHISLGLFYCLLLEEECHPLDMMVAESSSTTDLDEITTPFKQYHAMIQEVSSLQAKKDEAQARELQLEQILTLITVLNEANSQRKVFKDAILI